MTNRRALPLLLILVSGACGPRSSAAQSPPPSATSDSTTALVAAGFGQLNQDVIALRLGSGNIEIRFTPLDERVMRLLANDAYMSLSLMVSSNRVKIDSLATRQGIRDPGLVLMSFFGLAPGASFDPDLVIIEARGRIYQPAAFVPLTATWGAQRLEVGAQAMAIGLYRDRIPVTEPFVISYLDASTDDWAARLTRFDRERSRIQAKSSNPKSAPGSP